MKRILALFFFSIVLAAGWVGTASAQKATPSDDEVNAIARQLYCPICENIPLDVCPTQACHDWRELIRSMLAEGKSTDQIKQYFVDHYGARVLPEPPAQGFNWGLYVVWPVLFLAGVFMVIQAFRVWKKTGVGPKTIPETEPQAEMKPEPSDDYVARLEEELRKRK